MCISERAIIKELREYLDATDELKEKMAIVERELKITFVKDKDTGKWTIAMKLPESTTP